MNALQWLGLSMAPAWVLIAGAAVVIVVVLAGVVWAWDRMVGPDKPYRDLDQE